MRQVTNVAELSARIAKGWQPNRYLSNMSMAFFSDPGDFVATSLFPICPVQQSASYYYTFNKADLARDNVGAKPAFGKVQPAVMGHTDDMYKCQVEQIIVGIDQIGALDFSRSAAPGMADPRRAKMKFIAEQINQHLDIKFARRFLKSGVWTNEWTGVSSSPTGRQFLKFSDGNFAPVRFFDERKKEMKERSRRKPNRLALGANSFLGLKENPDILERVKYTGTTANPANVTTNVLAQLFGIERVVVLEGSYNAAGVGQEDMQYICDEDCALLAYATDTPSIDEPSAGYTFSWDMLGNGMVVAVDQFEGEPGTHAEFAEGLMSNDMKKTCDELGIFLTGCM